MYINIAANLVVMTQNTSYRPTWVNSSVNLKDHVNSQYDPLNQAASSMCGPGHWDKAPIFAVQIVKNKVAGYIRLWLFNTPTLTPIDVDTHAFVAGGVYHMYVDKYTVIADDGVTEIDPCADFQMIGHLCYAYPIDLV